MGGELAPEAGDEAAIGGAAGGSAVDDLEYVKEKCDLEAFPADFEAVAAKATVLNVMGNKITQVPASIGSLSRLVELNVSENQLSVLCPEIGRLVALQVLDVSDNKLTALEDFLGM